MTETLTRRQRAANTLHTLHRDLLASPEDDAPFASRVSWFALILTAILIVTQHDIVSPRARDMSLIRGGMHDIHARLPLAFVYAFLAQLALFLTGFVALAVIQKKRLRDLIGLRPSVRALIMAPALFISLAPFVVLAPVLFEPEIHPRFGLLFFHTWTTPDLLLHAGALLAYILAVELFYRGALLSALRPLAGEHTHLLVALIYAFALFDAHWSLALTAFFEGWLLAILATQWRSPLPGALVVWLLTLAFDHAWLGMYGR